MDYRFTFQTLLTFCINLKQNLSLISSTKKWLLKLRNDISSTQFRKLH
jgi:hypothetical protein